MRCCATDFNSLHYGPSSIELPKAVGGACCAGGGKRGLRDDACTLPPLKNGLNHVLILLWGCNTHIACSGQPEHTHVLACCLPTAATHSTRTQRNPPAPVGFDFCFTDTLNFRWGQCGAKRVRVQGAILGEPCPAKTGLPGRRRGDLIPQTSHSCSRSTARTSVFLPSSSWAPSVPPAPPLAPRAGACGRQHAAQGAELAGGGKQGLGGLAGRGVRPLPLLQLGQILLVRAELERHSLQLAQHVGLQRQRLRSCEMY